MLSSLRLLSGEVAAAEALARSSFEIARALDAQEALARSQLGLGQVELARGRTDLARAHFGDALARCRESGDREGEGYALLGLARAALRAGAVDSARRHANDGADVFRDSDRTGGLRAAWILGEVALAAGDPARARGAVHAGLRASAHDPIHLAPAFELLGRAEAAAGDPQRAAELLEGAAALRARLGTVLDAVEQRASHVARAALQERLGEAYSRVACRMASASLEELSSLAGLP